MPGFLIDRPDPRALRVAVTRPRHRASALCESLRTRGFVPLLRSLVRIESQPAALIPMIRALAADAAGGRSQWLLLTSIEAVRALDTARRALETSKGSPVAWPSVRAACVGPATAAAASRAGLDVAIVPPQWDGAALAAALHGIEPGTRVYWPRAEAADQRLKDAIAAGGADVRDVVAYRTVPDVHGSARLERDLRAGRVDVVLLLSPSAVDAYAALNRTAPGRVIVGVIGGSTRARAEHRGIAVDVEPPVHGVADLVEALRQYVNGKIFEGGTEK